MGDTIHIRQKRDRGFTKLSNAQIRDDRISWKARGLLAYLLSLPDWWQLRVSKLVEQGPDGRHSTRAGLAELQKFGYVLIERERNARGRFERTLWTIVEEPSANPRDIATPATPATPANPANPRTPPSPPSPPSPRSENRIVDSVYHDPENQLPVKRTGTTEIPSLKNTTTTPDLAAELTYPSLTSAERSVVVGLVQGFSLDMAQALLDELAGAMAAGRVKSSRTGYMRGMVKKANNGEFVPELGLSIADRRTQQTVEGHRRHARHLEEVKRRQQRNSESSRAAYEECMAKCGESLGTPKAAAPCPSGADGHQGDPVHASLRGEQ